MSTISNETKKELEEWALKIAKCESFKKWGEKTPCESFNTCGKDEDEYKACEQICKCQEFNKGKRQLPEPYNGNPQEAKIVFISSNPNIGYWEDNPTEEWEDKDILDFFNNRFDENKPDDSSNPYVIFQEEDGNYRYYTRCVTNVILSNDSKEKTEALMASLKKLSDGKYTTRYYKMHSVPFWEIAAHIAKELLADRANRNPLKDCLFTEVVHCKSKGEKGVEKAMGPCGEKFYEFLKILCKIWDEKRRKVLIAIVTGKEAKKSINEFLKTKFKLRDSELFIIDENKTGKNKIVVKSINGVEVWFIAAKHLNYRGFDRKSSETDKYVKYFLSHDTEIKEIKEKL